MTAPEPAAAFGPGDRIVSIELDTAGAPPPSPEMEQDQRVAHFELLEENHFRLRDEPAGAGGPVAAALRVRDGALRMSARRVGAAQDAFDLELNAPALAEAIADYTALCEAYVQAVRDLAPSQIERLDAERREAHAEGARAVSAALSPAAEMDAATGRRLFSLVCSVAPPSLSTPA